MHELGIMDTPPNPEFDAIVQTASLVFGAPIALISLMGEDRQWFKAQVGLEGVSQTTRDEAFCAYTILDDGLLEVFDAQADARFSDNPLVTGPSRIRFYAGMPLKLSDGTHAGTLCVLDSEPRRFTEKERAILRCLTVAASHALEKWSDQRKLQKAENALARKRQRIEDIVAATKVATWEWDLRTGTLTLSERYAGITGMPIEELSSASAEAAFATVHPDDLLGLMEKIDSHLAGMSESYDHEFRMWHRDGHLVWVRCHGRIMMWATDGSPELMCGTVEDVSERRHQQIALAKSAAFLHQIGRLAGVGGWELDLATGALSWSAGTATIYGVSPDFMPTLEEAVAFYAPEAQPLIQAALTRAAAGGGDWDLELPLVQPNGKNLWVRAVGSAVIEKGKVARLVGAIQDVTEHVEQRRALEAANDRVTLATEAAGIGIWELDIPSGAVVWGKRMFELYGKRPADGVVAYEDWLQCLHPEDRDWVDLACRTAGAGGEPYNVEFRAVWEDGSIHFIHASARSFGGQPGHPKRMLGLNWDVTELATRNVLLMEAEREAAAAGTKYRLLAENSSDVIVLIDRQLIRRYVSPSCRDLLGYSPDDLIGSDWGFILHSEDVERLTASSRELFTKPGQDRDQINYRVRHHDGHWVWVEAVRRIHSWDASGAPLEISASLRDITLRVAAETALRESEERYHSLMQSHAVTEALYMLDPTGKIESWNAGAQRIKGYTSAEIIGRNFATFFTPEDVASGEPARVLAIAKNTGRFTTEAWRLRKDGSLFLASIVIGAVRREDGTLRGFAKSTRDITERRVEEEQRAIIIEAAPNGMMIVNEDGIITLVNSQAEQIFHYPNGSLAGQPVEVLFAKGVQTALGVFRSAFTEARSDRGMAGRQEFSGRRRDGSAISIEIMLSAVKTPRGRIVVASLFDITERLRRAAEREEVERCERLAIEATNADLDRLSRHLTSARDRADRANRAKSRFLAGMSHELRTPLNGILGYAQLLRMEGGLNTKQSGRVDAMLGAGKHLLHMITRVLDLSEIESEHNELQATEFDIREVAEACLELIRPPAGVKGLTLNFTVEPGAPRQVFADVTRLRQVLLNLLGNAVKFTSQGEIALRLQSWASGSELRIEVADTGPGVPAEQRGRLFQEFERLDTDATRAAEGSGLGLSLAARLAGLMGGRLGHEDNPGGGSVFWLELPIITPDIGAASATIEPEAHSAPSPGRKVHVLVVDDVLMNREIASSFLTAAGHEVTCAEGGVEAVAVAAGTDFDVVLMDVRMPEVDGLEATRRIRALEGARGRVPIVALTAQAFTEQVAACREAGMDSHLAKPFDLAGLNIAVERAIAAGPRLDLELRSALAQVMPATSFIDPELPIVELKAFERTAVHLAPQTVIAYLRTIAELGEMLLRTLHETDVPTQSGGELVDLVHKLVGSAGMFGFERLAAAGRAYEQAVQAETVDAALAAKLGAAAEATCKEIYVRTS